MAEREMKAWWERERTYKWNRLEYFLVLRDALGRKTQPRRGEMVRELIEEMNR